LFSTFNTKAGKKANANSPAANGIVLEFRTSGGPAATLWPGEKCGCLAPEKDINARVCGQCFA